MQEQRFSLSNPKCPSVHFISDQAAQDVNNPSQISNDLERTMNREDFWLRISIAYLCGFATPFVLVAVVIAFEPLERKVRTKMLMLEAMNYADDDARWRLKQMATAVRTSTHSALQEIQMYEQVGAFPAEWPHAQPASPAPAVPHGNYASR